RGAAGTAGVGSGIHMCMIYFQNQTGTKFPLVPYRGAAPVMQDLMAGQIDLSCPEAGQAAPEFRSGAIQAVAVLTQKRWFAAPDVPTIDEAGVPGLHFPFWRGMWAPKGTPKEIVDKINAAIVDALADPGSTQTLHRAGTRGRRARSTDSGGARRDAQGRDRKMVADHQGGEHQGGMMHSDRRKPEVGLFGIMPCRVTERNM